MMRNKINFIALAAGISSLILIVTSFFVPWWQFSAGSPASVQVNFSPVNFNVSHSGSSVAIPLILALNIACLLTLLAGAITLTIYSLKPTQPYSKQLLGFGYKKPIYTLAAFIAILIAVPILMQVLIGISIPINGSAVISPNGSNQSASVSAVLNWPFYFAFVVTGLSIAARFYHRSLSKSTIVTPTLPPQ
jgi:hypothetical protein